jgi:hypothetical protein
MTTNSPRREIPNEFNIQEGAASEHHEILSATESLHWAVSVDYGYDIEFSIIVRSRLSGYRGTWVLCEKERIINRDGYINASDLQEDGIKLPLSIEFRMDNSYSWFNPKRVYLRTSRTRELPMIEEHVPSPPQLDTEFTPPSPPKRVDSTATRLRDEKARIDLLWMSHVVGEALMRCPDTVPEIRTKLIELKELLSPHIVQSNHQAII